MKTVEEELERWDTSAHPEAKHEDPKPTPVTPCNVIVGALIWAGMFLLGFLPMVAVITALVMLFKMLFR